MAELDVGTLKRNYEWQLANGAPCVVPKSEMNAIIAALEDRDRLRTALKALWDSLHDTENGELFEDFTQERWDQFNAAYEQAAAALEGRDG